MSGASAKSGAMSDMAIGRELPEGLERLTALVRTASGVAEPPRREGPLFDVIRDFVDTGALPPRGAS